MASGNNNQQWGYSHFQPGQDTGQAGNFVNQGFGHGDSNNGFAISQQWPSQDSQFIPETTFSNFQQQSPEYAMQNFQGNNAHVQSHQHPSSYTASLAIDSSPDMPWDYDFNYGTNPLAGMGEGAVSYGNGVPQGVNSNGVQPPSSFSHDMANNVPGQQQQFPPRQSPGNMHSPNQAASYGRSTQQSPAQTISQPMPTQRQAMAYQPTAMHQHQHQHHVQAQPAIVPQHQQSPMTQQQQHQHQQQQQHVIHQQQQPNPLQAGGQQPTQVQNISQLQQMSRIGTPQSATPAAQQPRQSPFNGLNMAPLSMPQQGQDARGSPSIPFSASRLPKGQPALPNASPGPSNAQTQSQFLPQEMVPMQQRPPQGPVSVTGNMAVSDAVSWTQPSNKEASIGGGPQPSPQPNLHPKTNGPVPSAAAAQHPGVTGLAPPRLIRRDDNALQHYASRHVGLTHTLPLSLPPGDNERAKATLGEIYDPDEVPEAAFTYGMPPGSKMRTNASRILCNWVKALKEGDVAGQNELEQQLTRHLGGSLPEVYVARMQEARAAKKRASAGKGPERSKTRPADEADAAEWDALGIIYLTTPQPTSAEIGTAVAAFGKLLRGHVGEYQKFKQKKKSATEADSAILEDKMARKLEIIDRAVAAANEWGDPQVVANLGGNQKLISDFVSCLIHANNSADHNGKMPKDVLRLMSAVTTIESDFLMTSLQFAKISKKFETKGDDEVREYVKRIKENAENRKETLKAAGEQQERTSTPDSSASAKGPSSSGSSDAKAPGSAETAKKKAMSAVAGRVSATSSTSSSTVKRPREEEGDDKSVKRVATESGSSQGGQKAAPAKLVVSAPTPAPAQSKLFGSGMLGVKKPPTKPVAKPLPAKADGAKAESKPDVKKDLLKKTEVAKMRKTEPVKAEAPSASKLGGIGALLESISNSKPKASGRSPPDKDAKSDKEETPEEKARRLRKEQRRHLRVSWKEGEDLTQVRIFHKDAEEDEGRASNMIRDAHDDRSEGMMLKQALISGMQADEEDEEDDELPYRPWFSPTGVDLTVIPQELRAKHFVNRGGLGSIETQQQKLMAERENKELMAVYTDPSDIPPTPKSPHLPPAGDTDMQAGTTHELEQNDPRLAEINLRWAEATSRGSSWARLSALRRAQKGQLAKLSDVANMNASNSHAAANNVAPQPAPVEEMTPDQQVYALLTSSRVKNWKDPNPVDPANPKTRRRHDYADPNLQRAIDMCEEIAEQLKGKPFPPAEPPEWMKHDKDRVAEWWHGYNKDKQRAEQVAQRQTAMQMAQQQTAFTQPQAAPQAAQTAADQQNAAAWAAYYAQLQQQQHQQAQPQAATDPNAAAWASYYAQQQQQQQQQQQPLPAPAQPTGDQSAQLQAVLAALSGTPAQATQAQQQSAAANSAADPQIQALLATLGATTSVQQQPTQAYQPHPQPAQSQAPNPQDSKYLAYILSLASGHTTIPSQQQQQQQQAHQQPPSIGQRRDDSHDRARDRDRDSDRDREPESLHTSRRTQNRGGKNNRDNSGPHQRGVNRDKIGTKPCVFWAKGMCQKGEQCTFRHD